MPLSASVSSLGMIQSLFDVALGDLRQRLQVLVGEQLGVGVALVDRTEDRLIASASPWARSTAALRVTLGLRGSRPAARPRR